MGDAGVSPARIAVAVGGTFLGLIGLVNVCLGIYLRTKLTDSNLPWSWPVHIVAGCVVTVFGTLTAIFVCAKAVVDKVGEMLGVLFGVTNLPSFIMAAVQAVASAARDAYLDAKNDPDLDLYERLEEVCLALSAITIIIICVIIGAFAIGYCRNKCGCCDCEDCLKNGPV